MPAEADFYKKFAFRRGTAGTLTVGKGIFVFSTPILRILLLFVSKKHQIFDIAPNVSREKRKIPKNSWGRFT